MDSVPLTWNAVGGICAVIALFGGIATFFLALKDRNQALEIDAVKTGAAAETKAVKESFEKELNGLGERLNAHSHARGELEARLRVVEREYVTRADHAQFRAELVAALDKVGDRVAGSMDKLRADLRDDFHSMNKRVAALERHE